MWHEERLLIDGELVAAEGGRTFTTLNPATGKVLAEVADAGTADADRAIAAARRAFDTTDWSKDHAFRARCLRQLHQAFLDELEPLRELTVADVGVPVMLTSGPALEAPIAMIEWYADLLDGYSFTEDLGEAEAMGRRSHRWVEREAVGVVAGIVPYNYPLQIILAKLVPALAAGCTVIIKGAPQTPLVANAVGALVARTDIPAGVVSVLTDSGAAGIGQMLTTDPRVDMVSFTGSTPTGRRIMAAASDTVKKVFLELGGKSAFVVLDDADLDLAAMLASFTICSHAGQGCAITSRLLVPKASYDQVVESAAAMLAGVPYGDPTDPGMMMGPLVDEVQRTKVDGYVQGAVAEGGRVVVGGKRPEHLPDGFFYEPTLVADISNGAKICQEEVFGPVLAVVSYDGDDDAVAVANDSIFGLSATVIGADEERATAVARRLRTGTVSINGGMWYGPDTPFGGYKQSGIGREMGQLGFEEYLEVKTLATPVE